MAIIVRVCCGGMIWFIMIGHLDGPRLDRPKLNRIIARTRVWIGGRSGAVLKEDVSENIGHSVRTGGHVLCLVVGLCIGKNTVEVGVVFAQKVLKGVGGRGGGIWRAIGLHWNYGGSGGEKSIVVEAESFVWEFLNGQGWQRFGSAFAPEMRLWII